MNLHNRLLLSLAMFSIVLFTSHASAAELSERQYRVLEKIQSYLAEGQYTIAIEESQKAADDWEDGLGLVLILQARGQSHQMLDRPEAALREYERALAMRVLEGTRWSSLAARAAQLHLMNEQTEAARALLLPALESDPGDGLEHSPAAYILLAVSYQLDELWGASLEYIRLAEQVADRLSDSVPDNWLTMRAAAEFQLEDYAAAEVTMKRLVLRAPDNRNYWLQLAAAQQFLDKPAEQLATLELASQRGLLEQTPEQLLMIQLQASQGLPGRAARNLVSVIEDAEASAIVPENTDVDALLVAYQRQARNFSQAAATLVDSDSQSAAEAVQLAMMDGDCELALQIADRHVRQLDGRAMLNAGQCALETGATEAARVWLQRSADEPETADVAGQWLTYLSSLREAGLR